MTGLLPGCAHRPPGSTRRPPHLPRSTRRSATAITESTWTAGSPRSSRCSTDGEAPADDATDAAATADLLRQAGKTLISTVGGASGPLYGTAFLRGAAALAGEHPSTAAAFVAALEAAAGGIAALGKAAEGEKTMLDALFPAARAAREALDGGGDLAAVVAAAHDAADAGAAATIPMLATKGRASYLGERSIGHQDPGATSSALLLGVLAATATSG